MSVELPLNKTSRYYDVLKTIKEIAEIHGVSLIGNYFVRGEITVGCIFKKTYPRAIGCIWIENEARKANLGENKIAFDYSDDEAYQVIADIAEETAKKLDINIRLIEYSHGISLVPLNMY